MKTLSILQEEIGTWQARTFGEANQARGKANHLLLEASEVVDALAAYEAQPTLVRLDALAEEVADCIILALGIAASVGFDAALAVARKMAKNATRKWRKPGPDGVCGHVRPEST